LRRLLARANSDLLRFLPAIFDGLFQSDKVVWRECLLGYLNTGEHLSSIVRHWRLSNPLYPGFIQLALDKALAARDESAIIQCLLLAMESTPAVPVSSVPANNLFFRPALVHLTSRKDIRWIREAWFLGKELPFFDTISEDETKLLLQNLLEVPRIEFHAERILSQIARRHRSLIWDYLGQRLKGRAEREGLGRYDAVPFRFHGLEKELSKDVKLAVSAVRRWYQEDPKLFRYLGGRLLSIVFPQFQAEISNELCKLVTNGTGTDADFVLAVMGNYHGEPATHEVLKLIVAKYPEDQSKLAGVRISLDNAGVVWGEFGFVEAMRQKKTAVESWLTDPRPEVRAFAGSHMRSLGLRIADEQRRAEEGKMMRQLQYDDEDGK
jgi:hypothetical protein